MSKLKYDYRQFKIGDIVVFTDYMRIKETDNYTKKIWVPIEKYQQQIGIVTGPVIRYNRKRVSDDNGYGGVAYYWESLGSVFLWEVKTTLLGKPIYCLPEQLTSYRKVYTSAVFYDYTHTEDKIKKEIPIRAKWYDPGNKMKKELSDIMKEEVKHMERDAKGRFVKYKPNVKQ